VYGFLTVVNPFSKYVAGGVCISSDPPLTQGSDNSNGLFPAVSPELHEPIFPPAWPTIDSTDVPPAFGMCTKIGSSSPSVFDCKFKSYLDVSLAYVSGGYAPKKWCWPETRDAFFPDDDAIANVKPTAETTTATIPFFKFAEEEEEEDEEEEEEVLASSAESNKGALSGSISLMEEYLAAAKFCVASAEFGKILELGCLGYQWYAQLFFKFHTRIPYKSSTMIIMIIIIITISFIVVNIILSSSIVFFDSFLFFY
jgi:hypothetical protein